MPPNADFQGIRNRFPNATEDLNEANNDNATVSTIPLKSIKGTECVIDGTIYDLTSFDHPGGESVLILGGNDVTIQYKMIHPYHTEHHLKKMKAVGKVDAKDVESE
jgi:fatty acid desaturase (delta-4 desaturase)